MDMRAHNIQSINNLFCMFLGLAFECIDALANVHLISQTAAPSTIVAMHVSEAFCNSAADSSR
jgi:hypothetical protein